MVCTPRAVKSSRNKTGYIRKYFFPYVAYLYNPISPSIEKYTDLKIYLETEAGCDGVFLDDTLGWVNTSLYVWHKTKNSTYKNM